MDSVLPGPDNQSFVLRARLDPSPPLHPERIPLERVQAVPNFLVTPFAFWIF